MTVAGLAEKFGLRLLNTRANRERTIEGSYVAYVGLALAGWLDDLVPQRVLLFGRADLGYLATLPEETAVERLRATFGREPSCIVLHAGLRCPQMLLDEADRHDLPVLASSLHRRALQPQLYKHLRNALAPRESLHGVMMDVYGIGTLLLGKSGIGKSECALELIKRGHRLVSDDVVQIKRLHEDKLVATAAGRLHYFMEIRGIGLIHVPSLFGVGAIADFKDVDLVVRLEEPEEGKNYERLGLEQPTCEYLGVAVPLVEIPVIKGKNLSILIEAAAMNQHLRSLGMNPAQIFSEEVLQPTDASPLPLLYRRP